MEEDEAWAIIEANQNRPGEPNPESAAAMGWLSDLGTAEVSNMTLRKAFEAGFRHGMNMRPRA